MAGFTALTGWRGLIKCEDSNIGYLRFTSEQVDVPLGQELDTTIHAGMRTSSIFTMKVVKPTGNITFPLLSDSLTNTAIEGTVVLETQAKIILKRAIQPYTGVATIPVLDSNKITIFRGDSSKVIYEPWINTLNISGDTNNRVEVQLGIKSIYGEVTDDTTDNSANVTFKKARAIMFNELDWSGLINSLSANGALKVPPTYSAVGLYPRKFTFNVDNGLMDDDTPSTDGTLSLIQRKRAIRGFALGFQKVKLDVTFTGPALPYGTNNTLVKQYSIPVGTGINIANLYTMKNGLVTTRTLNVPGNEEIAMTEVTIEGMMSPAATEENSPYFIEPGSLLT